MIQFDIASINRLISKIFDEGIVVLSELKINNLDARAYNALLLTPAFWEALHGREKILFFQTDSVLCNHSNYKLNNFLDFDYIGSIWPRLRPIGITIDGGNGGLSLRSWKESMRCLKIFPASFWPGGEDGYYGFHLELIGAKIGKSIDCAKFSTQSFFQYKSFGAHNISCLNKKDRDAFIKYCPEAKKLL